MCYTADKSARKFESEQEKKLREARRTVRWLPYVAAVFVAVTIAECIALARHPGVAQSLRILFSAGAMLYLSSHWRKARATLAGVPDTLTAGPLILGILLMASGRTLDDMWRYRHIALFHLFGALTLAGTLFCVALIALEWAASRRTATLRRRGERE